MRNPVSAKRPVPISPADNTNQERLLLDFGDDSEDRMVPVCRQLLALVLVLIVGGASPALAQNHIVDPGELAAALTRHAAAQEADRAAVRAALARPEALRVASLLGLDLGQAATLVGSLDGNDLRQAASAARQVDLVGGASTVTISTTTIIVGLLVLILLIVALK